MKKFMLFLMLISVALIGMGCVSAAHADNYTIADCQAHPVIFHDAADSNNPAIDENSITNDDQTPGSFDDLQSEIDNALDGSVLILTRDYNGNDDSRVQVNKNLIIDGQGHTIDCLNKNGCSAFYSSSGEITLKNLRIINANNDFTEKGGAIYITDDARYIVCNCTFENNHAENKGGAIYSEGSLSIVNSTFLSNDADTGGAVYCKRDIEATNTLFAGNIADYEAGAIYTENNANVNECIFESNQVLGVENQYCYGGAIRTESSAKISNSTFSNNYAKNKGGAVYTFAVTLLGSNSFENNTAGDFGGAIYTYIFEEDVKNAKFINNRAENKDGGAICIDDETKVTFSQCIFVNNHCGRNGGVFYIDSTRSHLTFENNFFNANTAGNKGQAVYNYGYYDSVESNCWSENNPTSKNDVLIGAHMSGSDTHIIDTNPLEMVLLLSKFIHNANETDTLKACFLNKTGTIFEGELFDLSDINFYSSANIDCSNRIISPSSASLDLTINSRGLHMIYADFYGYGTFRIIISK